VDSLSLGGVQDGSETSSQMKRHNFWIAPAREGKKPNQQWDGPIKVFGPKAGTKLKSIKKVFNYFFARLKTNDERRKVSFFVSTSRSSRLI